MIVGMLWYDDSEHRDLAAKIQRAARTYEKRYGQRPSVVWINPALVGPGGLPTLEGMEIRTTDSVLTNHFCLGSGSTPR